MEIADIVSEKTELQKVAYRYTGGIDGRGWKKDVKMMHLSINAAESLGWRPRHSSRESIEDAVEALLEAVTSR